MLAAATSRLCFAFAGVKAPYMVRSSLGTALSNSVTASYIKLRTVFRA